MSVFSKSGLVSEKEVWYLNTYTCRLCCLQGLWSVWMGDVGIAKVSLPSSSNPMNNNKTFSKTSHKVATETGSEMTTRLQHVLLNPGRGYLCVFVCYWCDIKSPVHSVPLCPLRWGGSRRKMAGPKMPGISPSHGTLTS